MKFNELFNHLRIISNNIKDDYDLLRELLEDLSANGFTYDNEGNNCHNNRSESNSCSTDTRKNTENLCSCSKKEINTYFDFSKLETIESILKSLEKLQNKEN